MKRMLIFAILSAFILGSMAYATETRVETMGEVNNIVKDDANIWLYPSTINYYPKLFIGEYDDDASFTDDDYYKIGAHFMFGEDGEKPMVLGTYFSSEPYLGHYEFFDADKVEDHADQRLNLFYGREISEMPFGFFLGYYSDGYKNEDSLPDNNYEESLTRFEIGFGLSMMEKKLDLSLGFGLTSWTDEFYMNDELGTVKDSEASGNMDIQFMGRYWMDPMGKYTLVPHFGFLMSKKGADWYGWDDGNWVVEGNYEEKTTIIDLGLGLNYDAMEDVLVVGDFGVRIDNEKMTTDYTDADMTDEEDEDKYTILPYFKVGIDAEVFKWMDIRSGVVTEWEKYNRVRGTSTDRTWSDANTSTYLGFGLNWGNFFIDACLDTDFLENGPYFITGDYTSTFAERITLKYAF